MRLQITGQEETRSPQKHTIYNNFKGYPTGLTWEVTVAALRISKEEFFENLFFSTERNGGNSYFYPKPEEDLTLCRYEWHHPWRNRSAQIRLGVVFSVRRGTDPHVGTAYLGTNDGFKKIGDPNNPEKISSQKISEFQDFISSEIVNANKPRTEIPHRNWQFFFYAEGISATWEKPFWALNGTMLILPPMIEEGVPTSAIVIKSSGISKGEAHRKAMQKFQQTLALLTLATGQTWQTSDIAREIQLLEGKFSAQSNFAEKLFPNGKAPKAQSTIVSARALSLVRYGLSILDQNQDQGGVFLSALFAYYGGTIAQRKTPSLANVGFIAALGLLANTNQKKCSGKIECSICGPLDFQHNVVGDRAAISMLVAGALNKAFGSEFRKTNEFERWVKKIYNTHRSQYVHSASHQYSEFSQVFSSRGPTTTLVPTAIPFQNKLVRKENEHGATTAKLPSVTRITLINAILQKANLKHTVDKLKIRQPDFSNDLDEEAFCGMPTSGWVGIA